MSRQPGQPGRVGHRWRVAQQAVFESETHCWLCGDYVDQRLSARGPMAPKSRSVDHLIQLQHGGDPYARSNTRLSHVGCNSGRSNRLRGLAREHCGCTHGRGHCVAIIPTQPRGYVDLDPSEV